MLVHKINLESEIIPGWLNHRQGQETSDKEQAATLPVVEAPGKVYDRQ
jgi:hypothetical protein